MISGIVRGAVAALLAAVLLAAAMQFFFPAYADSYPRPKSGWWVPFVIWIGAGTAGILEGVRTYRRASRRVGECSKCGYSLSGLIVPRCPECGKPFDLTVLQEGGQNDET